jgi:hypothetical protein
VKPNLAAASLLYILGHKVPANDTVSLSQLRGVREKLKTRCNGVPKSSKRSHSPGSELGLFRHLLHPLPRAPTHGSPVRRQLHDLGDSRVLGNRAAYCRFCFDRASPLGVEFLTNVGFNTSALTKRRANCNSNIAAGTGDWEEPRAHRGSNSIFTGQRDLKGRQWDFPAL